jgi:hypothetical protein
MRRSQKIIFASSLLVAAAFSGFWVRSYYTADSIGRGTPFTGTNGAYYVRFRGINSSRGSITIGSGHIIRDMMRSTSIREGIYSTHDSPPPAQQSPKPAWSILGMHLHRMDIPSYLHLWALEIPDWMPTITAALPAAWLGYRVLRRRNMPGSCPACGYNLTGNVSGVCPECGRQITTAG